MLKRKSLDGNPSLKCSPAREQATTDKCEPSCSKSYTSQLPILHLVVDTNIFLSRTNGLRDLICTPILGNKPPVLVIPWVVLQELDSMKANSKNNDLSKKARTANTFIHEMLMIDHPHVRGQSALEAVEKVNGWCPERNDDKILHCCLQLRQNNPKSLVMLLSNDRNLCNKARVSYIKSYTWEDFLKKFRIAVEKPGGKGEKAKQDCSTPTILDQKTNLCEVITEVQGVLMDQLVPILEKEVKEAYDNLWLRMFPVKPPWSLADVFTCFVALWGGVFGLLFPRRLEETMKHLKEQFKWKTHCISASETMVTLALLEDLFLEIQKRYGKQAEILKRIASWKETVQQLKESCKTRESAISSNPPVKRKCEDDAKNSYTPSSVTIERANATKAKRTIRNTEQSASIEKRKVCASPSSSKESISTKVNKERVKSNTHEDPPLSIGKRPKGKRNRRRKCKIQSIPKRLEYEEKPTPTTSGHTQRTQNSVEGNELLISNPVNSSANSKAVVKPHYLSDDANSILQLFNHVWEKLNYLSGLAMDCLNWPHSLMYAKPSVVPSHQEAVEFLPRLHLQLVQLELSMKSALSSFSDEDMENFLKCLVTTVPNLQNDASKFSTTCDARKLKSFCTDPQNREILQNGYNQLYGYLTTTQQCLSALRRL